MKNKDLLLVATLAAVVIVTTAVVPMVVEARPAFEIPVEEEPDAKSIDGAMDQGWETVPAASVPLSSAGAGVPAADNTTIEEMDVQAATTESRLYLRLSWDDATNDTSNSRVRAFADTVAVQMPVNESARPPIAMGGTDNMVNVWYWSGTGTTEELLAGGPGTTSQFGNATVTTNATYRNGTWHVVFSRPLEVQGENRTTVPTNADLDVAFAAWNGSNMERSGQKAASEWYYLALGPGPQGPPYEAILWGIAGIGIVVTTLITIEGIRRTRGE
jgi:DMSO reductase family type II enzyme heme b subunit